jgi:hypothetical protein
MPDLRNFVTGIDSFSTSHASLQVMVQSETDLFLAQYLFFADG